MFQFRRFPTYTYLIQYMLTGSSPAGFPHSDIHGSQAAFASPWLFVDRYVLRRLLVPRHSPYALSSLTMFDRIIHLLNHLVLLGFSLDDKYIVVYPIFLPFHIYLRFCSVFKVHGEHLCSLAILSSFSVSRSQRCASARAKTKTRNEPKFGGLKWTRTTDLTLIRRAL